jgi:hypothetical protein
MFPKGYDSYSGVGGTELVRPELCNDPDDKHRSPLRYNGMDIDVAEIGLFFAYPWPEERELIQELFDAVAAEGAILVAYHTDKEVRVFRKVASGGRVPLGSGSICHPSSDPSHLAAHDRYHIQSSP